MKKKISRTDTKKWIKKWGDKSIFMLSFLPIPIPFDLFTVAAGYLKMDFKKFFVGLLVGKCLKYGLFILISILGINLLLSAWNFISLNWLAHIV